MAFSNTSQMQCYFLLRMLIHIDVLLLTLLLLSILTGGSKIELWALGFHHLKETHEELKIEFLVQILTHRSRTPARLQTSGLRREGSEGGVSPKPQLVPETVLGGMAPHACQRGRAQRRHVASDV